MADIISYFTKNDILSAKEGVEIYDFTGDPEVFVQDCVQRFRESYISDEMLERIVSKPKYNSRKEAIERRLPKKTKNIAGDFGEILSYYLWTETFAADANICPKKIRWKEHPDMPSHLVDVILLKRVDESNAKNRWDKFSWFGLDRIDSNGEIIRSSSDDFQLSIQSIADVLEGMLLEILEPRSNRRGGNGFSGNDKNNDGDLELGEYSQVVDEFIEKEHFRSMVNKYLSSKQ